MKIFIHSFKDISIRWKLLFTVLVVAACAIAIAIAAIELQLRSANRAAVLEAEHVANAIATTGTTDGISNPAFLQKYLEGLGRLYERDIMIVDRRMIILASTDPKGVGTRYDSPEPGWTVVDGVPRAFVGADASSPGLAKQIVVPFRSDPLLATSPIVGALIFEYTLFYDMLMADAWISAGWTGLVALLILGFGLALARQLSGTILRPLGRLMDGVISVAAGNYGVRVHPETRDEIGQLATAFNEMSADLDRARTAAEIHANELAHANKLLQEEIEKQKAAALRIEYLAYHDSLTTLPNRAMFGIALGQAFQEARRRNRNLAVFFVDLDRFKQINDTLGHDVGDILLQEVAKRLRQALRASDLVARLGGDEFVILLTELEDQQHAETVAMKVLTAIAKPFTAEGQELRVTASIGVSLYPKDGLDEQTLMKYADVAMYQAKEAGKAVFAFYSKTSNVNTFERLALESSLRLALDRNELLLHYQPKKNFRTDEVTGMEALIRWQHPVLGLVSPLQFIPIAEETGLIVTIGKWVLRTACLQTMRWHAAGLKNLTIAVTCRRGNSRMNAY